MSSTAPSRREAAMLLRPEDVSSYTCLGVTLERGGALCDVELRRPRSLNSLSLELLAELEHLCAQLERCRGVRVVIIRGAGAGFCSGADLSANVGLVKGAQQWDSRLLESQELFSHAFARLAKIPQPIITAAHGVAAGGGFALFLTGDVRICAENVKLNAAFIRIGLSGCELGTSYYLPKIVGLSNASEILMTGCDVDAQRALRIGLVSHVAKDQEELKTKAFEIADQMLKASPLGLVLTKKQLHSAADGGSFDALTHSEDVRQLLCLNDRETIDHLKKMTSKFTKGAKL